MLGETLGGRYTLVRQLGAGGMGAVYEARHAATGRRVAVKVILGDLAASADAIARFEAEAMAAGAIESQHIAQVLDAGNDPATGTPFLAMEYLTGEDLGHLLDRAGKLPVELALRIAAQACAGLAKAHAAGVVHRDVKPANIFLAERDDDVVVKLLDFGVAKMRGEDGLELLERTALTRPGAIIGSPRYMSPEQARGKKWIDARTDLWSLGVVLYEALSGRTPVEDVETLGDLILTVCSEPSPPVTRFAPDVPASVAALIQRALAIDPDARWQSAEEMLAAIRAELAGAGVTITRDALAAIAIEPRAAHEAPTVPSGEQPARALTVAAAREAVQQASTRTVHRATSAARAEPEGAAPPPRAGAGEPDTGPRSAKAARRSPVKVIAAGLGAVAIAGLVAARFSSPAAAPPATVATAAPPAPSAAPPSSATPPLHVEPGPTVAPSTASAAPAASAPAAVTASTSAVRPASPKPKTNAPSAPNKGYDPLKDM